MADGKGKISAFLIRVRQAASRWRRGRGIEFRVSFFMTAALILVATLVGAFFFWEDKKTLSAELRHKAVYVAQELAAMTADTLGEQNRYAIHKKLKPYFAANEDTLSGSILLYAIAYDHKCNPIIGSTATEIIAQSGSFSYMLPQGNAIGRDSLSLMCTPSQASGPVLLVKKGGVYDYTIPVMSGIRHVGFMRVGVSGQQYGKGLSAMVQKAGVALLGILLVGLAFSRIIAIGIIKPILRLSEAVEKLSQQNWDSPIPVKGFDEISKLGNAFNHMALTLKEREASLSRGNGELFILHTAGLDFMESLDRATLLAKIAAHAEDLVRADTIAISMVNRSDGMLTYLGVFGSKSKAIKERELPMESGGIYNWFVSYGTPLLIQDAQDDFRLDSDLMRSIGIKSMIIVPLWSSNTLSGLLTAINKKGAASFDKHDLRLFTVFSSLVAAALQNSALYNDLKEKIKELNTAQEQLVHSTRMATIGELSASVAHEINNPLTSVLGYTTHLLKTVQLPEAPGRILRIMEQEILRVRKFIRNLLDFARHKPSWMQPADIALPLREATALVQGIARTASVAIHEDYPPAPVTVNMDHNEMKQVFLNIVNNAIQAMPQGGELRIRLGSVDEHESVVEFSDTGVGIAPENIDKIFRPFFTTKNNGDGTGLGLSISHRIVYNHGGRIETESEAGKGAVFRVFLPLYQNSRERQNTQR
jgi:signal transduction histidine kinase/HAMP domain-containing protein